MIGSIFPSWKNPPPPLGLRTSCWVRMTPMRYARKLSCSLFSAFPGLIAVFPLTSIRIHIASFPGHWLLRPLSIFLRLVWLHLHSGVLSSRRKPFLAAKCTLSHLAIHFPHALVPLKRSSRSMSKCSTSIAKSLVPSSKAKPSHSPVGFFTILAVLLFYEQYILLNRTPKPQ